MLSTKVLSYRYVAVYLIYVVVLYILYIYITYRYRKQTCNSRLSNKSGFVVYNIEVASRYNRYIVELNIHCT